MVYVTIALSKNNIKDDNSKIMSSSSNFSVEEQDNFVANFVVSTYVNSLNFQFKEGLCSL